jgi:hypothetical protein
MANRDSVSKAIEILQWAVKNNKTITEAQAHFEVADNYVRSVRRRYPNSEVDALMAKVKGRVGGSQVERGILDDRFDSDLKSGQKKFVEGADGSASYQYKGSKMITSLDEAVEFFKIDTDLWEVERYLCNSYPVSAREREQNLTWDKGVMSGTAIRANKWTTTVNYQVKVWLKKRETTATAWDFEAFYKDLLKKHKPLKYPKIKHEKLKGNDAKNLLEVNICDLHLGKLCWGEEVNNNYDIKIATRRFQYALKTLVQRALSSGFDRILFPVGNDFFNSDNYLTTTTAGTRQDDDVRWQKSFKVGVKLLVEGIDFMKQYAPVDILVVPGNHDLQKCFYLGETLTAWYRNDDSVTIDNSPNPRKYYEYGQNLIGWTHGDKEKIEKLRALMAFEAKAAWARTSYKEFHLGHNHRKLASELAIKSDILKEELGIVVRSMASLAGTDVYHHIHGYVGPVRAAEAYLWNFHTGMIGSFNSNIIIGDDQ